MQGLSKTHIARDLKLSNMLALAALFWDGAVVPEASLPLEEETRDILVAELEAIVADPALHVHCKPFLTWLRFTGFSRLSVAEMFMPRMLMTELRYYIIDSDLVESTIDYLCSLQLGNIFMRHFREVMEICSRVIQRHDGEVVDRSLTGQDGEVKKAMFAVPRTALGDLFTAAAATTMAAKTATTNAGMSVRETEMVHGEQSSTGDKVERLQDASMSTSSPLLPPIPLPSFFDEKEEKSIRLRLREERGASAADAIDDLSSDRDRVRWEERSSTSFVRFTCHK